MARASPFSLTSGKFSSPSNCAPSRVRLRQPAATASAGRVSKVWASAGSAALIWCRWGHCCGLSGRGRAMRGAVGRAGVRMGGRPGGWFGGRTGGVLANGGRGTMGGCGGGGAGRTGGGGVGVMLRTTGGPTCSARRRRSMGTSDKRDTAVTLVLPLSLSSCAKLVTPRRSSRAASSLLKPSMFSGGERELASDTVFSSIIGLVMVVKSMLMRLAPVSLPLLARSRTLPVGSRSTNTFSSRCSSLSA